jgi:geranylgeranyl diphosphate synthase type I
MRYNNPMTDALTNILSHKREVDAAIVAYLEQKKNTLSPINGWGNDVIDRLITFTTSGKSTRGSLAVYISTLFQKKKSQQILDAACALEFFHSGFLIHDDIMDKDALRRGRPSIWEQYRAYTGNSHIGISQAINAGDLCLFMGQELAGKSGITDLVSKELPPVIIAQMQDIHRYADATLSKDDVISLYRYKTARYTFSLSMAAGATIARCSQDTVDIFDRLGESMGLLYQIRDDELSVEGDSSVTGKPVGSDERNDKQTLARLLDSEEMNDLKVSLFEHCDDEIVALPIGKNHREELASLVRFCMTRKK